MMPVFEERKGLLFSLEGGEVTEKRKVICLG